jgi:hypothetical protein
MSFEVTHEALSKPQFRTGLNKILNAQIKDFKTAYHIGRVGDLLEQKHREAKRTFEKLAKSHDVYKEVVAGSPIPDDKKESWEKAHDEFLAHKIKVDKKKIRAQDLEGVVLSPLEVTALECLIDGIDRPTD